MGSMLHSTNVNTPKGLSAFFCREGAVMLVEVGKKFFPVSESLILSTKKSSPFLGLLHYTILKRLEFNDHFLSF